jgi:hypothetical protein
VTRTLSALSALVFYPLGLSAFLAYLLLRNDILAPWPAFWLRIVDLPLAGSGLLLGAIALHRSLAGGAPARGLGIGIGLIAGLLFLSVLFLNFSPLLFP